MSFVCRFPGSVVPNSSRSFVRFQTRPAVGASPNSTPVREDAGWDFHLFRRVQPGWGAQHGVRFGKRVKGALGGVGRNVPERSARSHGFVVIQKFCSVASVSGPLALIGSWKMRQNLSL